MTICRVRVCSKHVTEFSKDDPKHRYQYCEHTSSYSVCCLLSSVPLFLEHVPNYCPYFKLSVVICLVMLFLKS